VKAATQQEQSLNNNSGCYGAPLDDITRSIFPQITQNKTKKQLYLPDAPLFSPDASPGKPSVVLSWQPTIKRDAQVQNQMLPPEQKSKEV
jgi:hypothetical protein